MDFGGGWMGAWGGGNRVDFGGLRGPFWGALMDFGGGWMGVGGGIGSNLGGGNRVDFGVFGVLWGGEIESVLGVDFGVLWGGGNRVDLGSILGGGK